MENYQLYRTNVLLGGQMKYDIILGTDNYGLIVKNFNITPIFDDIYYDKYLKPLIRNTNDSINSSKHGDNIKDFYAKVSGSFYNGCINELLNQNQPLPENYQGKLYMDNYEMGCRRMSYDLYNKQLSFFCPIWLEQLAQDEYLVFDFVFYADPAQTKQIYKKQLRLKKRETGDAKNYAQKMHRPGGSIDFGVKLYHNDFVNYLNQYIESLGLNSGQDYVINIPSQSGKNPTLNAFNVKTGIPYTNEFTCELKGLREIFESHQHILLEQNQLLIHSLKNNTCIAKQLFNFNFCFNLEDMLPKFTIKEFFAEKIYMSMEVYINNDDTNKSTKLDIKDFYSNHDFIQRSIVSPSNIVFNIDTYNKTKDMSSAEGEINWEIESIDQSNDIYNVLSYYNDHRYIKTVDKNKLLQSIIHWTPSYNRSEILNFYPGFMSCNVTKTHTQDVVDFIYNGYNMDTPQLDSTNYNRQINPFWCNAINIVQHITNEDLIRYLNIGNNKQDDEQDEESNETDINPVVVEDSSTENDIIPPTEDELLILATANDINNKFASYATDILEDILVYGEDKYSHLYSKFSKNCYVRNVNYNADDTTMDGDVNVLFINISNFLHDVEYGNILSVDNDDITQYKRNISNDLRDRIIKKYSNNIVTTKYYRNDDKSTSNYIFEAHRYNNYVLIIYTGDFLSEREYSYIDPEDPNADLDTGSTNINQLNIESFAHDIVHSKFISLYIGDSGRKIKPSSSEDSFMRYFHTIINSPKKLNVNPIRIYTRLKPISIKGPSINVKEIDLVHTNQNSIIYRSLGGISPKFVGKDDQLFNYKYSKIKYDKNDTENFRYITSKYLPLYPSINHFKFTKDKQFYDCPVDEVIGEYNLMNYNGVYSLTPYIFADIEQRVVGNVYEDLDELIMKYIYNYYKTGSLNDNKGDDDNELKYITSLYNYTYELIDTFMDDNNNQVYKYNVQIKLK